MEYLQPAQTLRKKPAPAAEVEGNVSLKKALAFQPTAKNYMKLLRMKR